MKSWLSAYSTYKSNSRLQKLFEKYKAEGLIFLAVFIIIFSSLKKYSAGISNGNGEQWVNLTNQMFYGTQDFLFSYGPLYWLTGSSSSQYNAFIYWSSIAFLSAINACFWSITFTIINKARSYAFFAVAFFLFFSSLNFPAVLFVLPFAIVAYLEFSENRPLPVSSRLMVFLGVMVGFLFYVRFFYGLVGLATFGSYFLIRLLPERKITKLFSFIAGVFGSYVLIGLIIFHDKASLINYLIINKNLSFGNSVDMTLDVINSSSTFLAATLVVACLNIYLFVKRRSLILTINILLLLFFKLGFSRTDHYIVYFVVPAAVLSLTMIFDKSKLGRLLFIITATSLYYISSTPSYLFAPTQNALIAATDFSSSYEDRMQSVYGDFKLEDSILRKIGESTIDIYPYNNEYAFANKLNYKYRPSFQNYMTLTPALDLMNKKFFESSERPKFVLVTSGLTCTSANCNVFDGFDQKFSLNEDPLTSSSILMNYHAVAVSKGKNGLPLILLEENNDHTIYSDSEISEELMSFGKWYKIPMGAGGVTKIIPDFKFTYYGKIKNLLFRGSILKIKYKLVSGDIREYRLNIINSQSGIWVSPLLDNFGLSGEKIDSIMFLSQSSDYFDPQFNSKWVNVSIPGLQTKDVTPIKTLTSALDVVKKLESTCDGSIDWINGIQPLSKPNLDAMEPLKVQGWLARSTNEGTLFDKTFVTLTDANKKVSFISTNDQVRIDVGAAFKKTSLNASGYDTSADVSTLSGPYILGMGGIQDNVFYSCKQFAIPVVINK